MRGIEYSQQLGREVDQLGHNFLTFHNHSKRHNGVIGVLARAARQALNAKGGAAPIATVIRLAITHYAHGRAVMANGQSFGSDCPLPIEGACARQWAKAEQGG